MSYDIRLCDPVTHETLEVDSPHLMAGHMPWEARPSFG